MATRFATTLAVAVVVIACMTLACSSSSTGSSAAGGAAGGCGSAPVSFHSDVMPVFAGSCSTSTICHGQMNNSGEESLYLGQSEGAGGPGDVAAVYAGLVGVASLEDPSMDLVAPGDLGSSYLWHKVSGDQNSDPAVAGGCMPAAGGPSACSDCVPGAPCGVQMPFTGALEPSATCVIQNWIMQGANNN
jgi:hypothetical protein